MIQIWYLSSGEKLSELECTYRLCSIGFIPNGTQVVTGSVDGLIEVWDIASPLPIKTIHAHHYSRWMPKIPSITISPNGQWMASASSDCTAKLFDLDPGNTAPTMTFAHSEPVVAVAFSPDGSHVATATTSVIRLWDVAKGTEISRLQSSTKVQIRQIVFSPDGTCLAYGKSCPLLSGSFLVDT